MALYLLLMKKNKFGRNYGLKTIIFNEEELNLKHAKRSRREPKIINDLLHPSDVRTPSGSS